MYLSSPSLYVMKGRKLHALINALLALSLSLSFIGFLTFEPPDGVPYIPQGVVSYSIIVISSVFLISGFGWSAIGLWFGRPNREVELVTGIGLIGGIIEMVNSLLSIQQFAFTSRALLFSLLTLFVPISVLVVNIYFLKGTVLYSGLQVEQMESVVDEIEKRNRTPKSIWGHVFWWFGESVGFSVLLLVLYLPLVSSFSSSLYGGAPIISTGIIGY